MTGPVVYEAAIGQRSSSSTRIDNFFAANEFGHTFRPLGT
jgi:hypothetical protein